MSETPNERDSGNNPSAFKPELNSPSGGKESIARKNLALSPEALHEMDDLLSSFRVWLTESEQLSEKRRSTGSNIFREDESSNHSTVDMHTLVAELIALRRETRLAGWDSKSSRNRLEMATEAFRQGLLEMRSTLEEDLSSELESIHKSLEGLRKESSRQSLVKSAKLDDVIEDLKRERESVIAAKERLGWKNSFLPNTLFVGITQGYDKNLQRLEALVREQEIAESKDNAETSETAETEMNENSMETQP